MTDFRVGVIGLGGIGSAAAYWASRRVDGAVLGIEQFELGHDRGGSEDHSRIIRLSYHTPRYVDLAKEAFRAWEEVEADSSQQLILRTGGLDLAPEGAVIGLDDYRSSMTSAGVPYEELDAGEVMRRWPQWQLGEDVTALFQERSGIAMASRANAAHRNMAAKHGATIVSGTRVESIREVGGEVEIVASGTAHRVEALVIAAGAWTNRMLAHLDVQLPLEVTLEQVVYVEPEDPFAFDPKRFPIFIWMDVPSFYGFPIFGEPAVKLSWDRCEIVTDADTRSFEPRSDVTEAVLGFARGHLPSAVGRVRLEKTCLYTLAPDRDFVIDRVPGTERIFVAVGSGHAFKFASVIGQILADLAIDGATPHDISDFAGHRPALISPDPVRSYMV